MLPSVSEAATAGRIATTEAAIVSSDQHNEGARDDGRPCLVTFGAPALGKPANEPTVFIFARLPGEESHSLLRSGDIAAAKISDMKWERVEKWEFGGMLPNFMQGSRQKFGQIFMSGANHGVIYGER